jgi:ABC-2 type transport system permease protein
VFRILLKKYLIESWLLWGSCALIILIFPWIRIWTVSQFELSGFQPLIEQFKAFEKFSPVPLSQFLTFEGMIGLTFAEPILLLTFLTFAIARGSDVVSGELGRGTMEMLLSQPITRLQMLLAHGTVSLIGMILLGVCCWIGIYAGVQTNSTPVLQPRASVTLPGTSIVVSNPFDEAKLVDTPLSELVSPSLYIASTINLVALGIMVFSLSVFMSSWDLYRWRTIGLVIGIYILQFLLFVLSKSTPRTRFLMPLSFFGAYQPDWMVQAIGSESMPMFALYRISKQANGFLGDFEIGPLGYTSILLALSCILYTLAAIIFHRRDLPAPS